MTARIVRIGGASGAWGDSPMATAQLLTAKVDYLMMDYLVPDRKRNERRHAPMKRGLRTIEFETRSFEVR